MIRLFGKMLVSGGLAAMTDLGVLYVLTERVHWGHSASVNGAYIVGIAVNFLLQKFWTFGHRDTRFMHVQLVEFLLVAALNMAVNAIAMAVLVGMLGLWYLGAQVVVLGSLVTLNFLVYRQFIFPTHVRG